MKKFLFSSLFMAICLCLGAQEAALQLIAENPDRAAGNMHSYEFNEIKDTKAPKGYKPFYISHYGRHGSRYELSHTFADAALRGLHAADSASLLTDEGKALLADITTIVDAHVGMEGALSPRGAREHKMIAARMADRLPKVFKSKTRTEVSSFSSIVPRCIMSMANFTTSLKEKFPKQQFTFEGSDRYQKIIVPDLNVRRPGYEPPRMPERPAQRPAQNRQAPPQRDWSRLMGQLFTDTDAAMALIGNPEGFARGIFSAGNICQDVDFLGIDINRKYFTPEELTYMWSGSNSGLYRIWAGSVENGDNVRYAARPLLLDIVEKADAALQDDSHRSADLRFGHDTAVLPLLALMGVDDPQNRRLPAAQAAEMGWYTFFQIPTATNCQIIFYKNKKGDVLAKVLYNEKEVSVPGVEPVSGPYYRWSDLRAQFLKLCND